MYVCIYTYIHTYIHTYLHLFIHVLGQYCLRGVFEVYDAIGDSIATIAILRLWDHGIGNSVQLTQGGRTQEQNVK